MADSGSLPLIAAYNCTGEVHLLVGTNNIGVCNKRVKSVISAGSTPVVVNPSGRSDVKQLLLHFQHESSFEVKDREFQLSDLTTLGRQLVARVVDRVFVNLPVEQFALGKEIYEQCIKLRIPINTFQMPEYSTFHMISTYTDPKGSGLQISVATNGQGCILANRIRREIIASLPPNISDIVTNMGNLRNHIINEDHKLLLKEHYQSSSELAIAENLWYGLGTDAWESHKLNNLVKEFAMTEREQKLRRTRWLSQVMEYYPMSKLADLSLNELESGNFRTEGTSSTTEIAESTKDAAAYDSGVYDTSSLLSTSAKDTSKQLKKDASISLVGSGPGSVSMLTLGALQEIKTADIILADKLVPQPVLDLISPQTETFIARKFPGNAERAQQELLEKGLDALQEGKKVVRLKQGDPYIFGRGGEEYLFFKEHGYEPLVLPGLSSSLAATVVSKIPATQRDIADQVLICTGTGRKGALPVIPEYVTSRTTIFLMALHRADVLVNELLKHNWDGNVPTAIVERASCKDQRVTRTLLKYVPEVVEEIGSRPPGLLVVGNAVNALISDDLVKFNDSHKFSIEEGFI